MLCSVAAITLLMRYENIETPEKVKNKKQRENKMHPYRTHTCGELRDNNVGDKARISGWIHRRRDHGGLIFIDLRDHYGITQVVFNSEDDATLFDRVDSLKLESVVTITGAVVARSDDTVNDDLPTGKIEIVATEMTVVSKAEQVPLQVNTDEDYGEETRLKYRFLDLRRIKMQNFMKLRIGVIDTMREKMKAAGFNEFQTPILTTSSPEGARDFLVPSRQHPGKFYALPQAPQQFKQLLMVAGYDKYFQIAPCFRDEDARADRTAGEFYQLDFEMSFVDQDDVFKAIEPIVQNLFEKFADFTGQKMDVSKAPFVRIPFDEAMLKYGTDKPDLRNPLEIVDVSEAFEHEDVTFRAFKSVIAKGGVVRAIRAPQVADKPRSFFDKLNEWARSLGAPGLGYITFDENLQGTGPIAKFIPETAQKMIIDKAGLEAGDAIFFACDTKKAAADLAGRARTKIGEDLGLIDESEFKFAWIVDYPLYEFDETQQKIDFSHNPFSMPVGGLKAFDQQDPLDIKAYQYDLVCNGYELSSGAIRNHDVDVMVKAFAIAGYDRAHLEAKFGGMLNAFKYGAPVHGGAALGIERIIMLLAGQNYVREVVPFPLNQQAEDLMMGGPTDVPAENLRDIHIKVSMPKPTSDSSGDVQIPARKNVVKREKESSPKKTA